MKKNELKSKIAYETIEEMITFQELIPGGMYSESKLIEITELGRSPIREALQRLVVDKMVEIFPSKGILITPISVESQVRLLEVRRNVGEFAMKLAAIRATIEDKCEMKIIVDELLQIEQISQAKQLVKLLKRTHAITVIATKNEFVDSVLSPLQGLSRRFWIAHLNNRNSELKKVAELYLNKLKAICQNNVEGTVKASLEINDYFTNYTHQVLTSLTPRL